MERTAPEPPTAEQHAVRIFPVQDNVRAAERIVQLREEQRCVS